MSATETDSHVYVPSGDSGPDGSWMVGHLLRRCHQTNTAIWAATVGSSLTAPQHAVLAVVAALSESHMASDMASDMQTVGAIAALDKATMTGVVRRLEAGGWLRREKDPDDLRRHTLALTPSARMALGQGSALPRVAQEEFLAPVPGEDRDRLMRHLRQLARVEEAPPIGVDRAVWERLIGTAGHLVRRAQQVHTAQWSAEFGPELTAAQFVVLRMLRAVGEASPSRLGELVALDRATMSGVVDRLGRRGLVTSTPDPVDRRSRLVALTEAGDALVTAALPRAESVQRQTLKPVPVADRAWLGDALRRLSRQ